MLRDMESNLAPCLALLREMKAMKIPRIIFISLGGDGLWAFPVGSHG